MSNKGAGRGVRRGRRDRYPGILGRIPKSPELLLAGRCKAAEDFHLVLKGRIYPAGWPTLGPFATLRRAL